MEEWELKRVEHGRLVNYHRPDSRLGWRREMESSSTATWHAKGFSSELEWLQGTEEQSRRAQEHVKVQGRQAQFDMAWNRKLLARMPAKVAVERTSGISQVLSVPAAQAGFAICIALSSDGRRLAMDSWDKVVVWDAETGQQLHVLEGGEHKVKEDHTYTVHCVEWSPDGKQLAMMCDCTIVVWDAEAGKLLFRLDHFNVVSHIAWSPDERQLAAALWGGDMTVWDAKTGELLYKLQSDNTLSANCEVWSPDARRLATGHNTMAVVWDAATGQLLHELHFTKVLSIVWSPDGRQLATASAWHTTAVWDSKTGELIHELLGYCCVSWSPQGRYLATTCSAAAGIWDAESGDLVNVLLPADPSSGSLTSVEWSPDGRLLATLLTDNAVALWDAKTGDCLRVLEGHTNDIVGTAWSPDGRQLVTVSTNRYGMVMVRRYNLRPDVDLLDTAVSVLFECSCPSSHGLAEHEPHTMRDSFTAQEIQTVARWLQSYDADCMGVDLDWLRTHMQQQTIEELLDTLRSEGFLLFSNDGDSMLYVSTAFLARQEKGTARSVSNQDTSQSTIHSASARGTLASQPTAAAVGGHNSSSDVSDDTANVDVAQAGTRPSGIDLLKACCTRHLETGTFQDATGLELTVQKDDEFGVYHLQYHKRGEVLRKGTPTPWDLFVDITLAICSSDGAQPRMRIFLNTLETRLSMPQSSTSAALPSDTWFHFLLPKSLRSASSGSRAIASSKGDLLPIIHHAEIGLTLYRNAMLPKIPLGVQAVYKSAAIDTVQQASAYAVDHGLTLPPSSVTISPTSFALPTPGQHRTVVNGPSVGTPMKVLEFAVGSDRLYSYQAECVHWKRKLLNSMLCFEQSFDSIKYERRGNEAYVDFYTVATPEEGFTHAVDLMIQLHVEGAFWTCRQIETAGRKTPLTPIRAAVLKAVLDTEQPATVSPLRLRVQPRDATDRPCRFQHSE